MLSKKLTKDDEIKLVQQLNQGSSLAFQELFHHYNQHLYRFSLSYLKSETEAEEIVQEVFMKIWEKRLSLNHNYSFHSYLFTIAFNAVKKRFNRRQKEAKYKYDLFQTLIIEYPSLEQRQDLETLLEKLERLIDLLPEKRQKIFKKRKQEGLSIETIAEEMNISPKTVKNQITEAMKFLKSSFENDEFPPLFFFFIKNRKK